MNKIKETKISKKMCYILRHNPDEFGIDMDSRGYVLCPDLCNILTISYQDLFQIVKNDDKNRYSFSPNGSYIKANQGHSIDIDHCLELFIPPEVLWHGSSTRTFPSIAKHGINKMNRHHVHLSDNLDTAKTVGSRHGDLIVYSINTAQMFEDGYKFYKSDNDVWLTDEVPFKYILQMSINGDTWNKKQ